jgi:hypothetical protein
MTDIIFFTNLRCPPNGLAGALLNIYTAHKYYPEEPLHYNLQQNIKPECVNSLHWQRLTASQKIIK